jgi:hypothetical protein
MPFRFGGNDKKIKVMRITETDASILMNPKCSTKTHYITFTGTVVRFMEDASLEDKKPLCDLLTEYTNSYTHGMLALADDTKNSHFAVCQMLGVKLYHFHENADSLKLVVSAPRRNGPALCHFGKSCRNKKKCKFSHANSNNTKASRVNPPQTAHADDSYSGGHRNQSGQSNTNKNADMAKAMLDDPKSESEHAQVRPRVRAQARVRPHQNGFMTKTNDTP